MSKGEHKSPAYLEKQPFGQVPYIVGFPRILCGCFIWCLWLGRWWVHLVRIACDRTLHRYQICRSGHSWIDTYRSQGIWSLPTSMFCGRMELPGIRRKSNIWTICEALPRLAAWQGCFRWLHCFDKQDSRHIWENLEQAEIFEWRCEDASFFNLWSALTFILQNLTLADLFHIPSGAAIQKLGADCLVDEKRPHVVR